MQLKLSTWCEVKEYLAHRKEIIIPVGSTEQHGPMGHMGTDFICPETIAARIGEETGTMVAPTLPIGMSQHHLAFPGSLTLRPSTLMALVKDLAASLAGHGFTHILFLNGHGGNVDAIRAAFSEIYAEYSLAGTPAEIHLDILNWYEGKRVQAISDNYFKGAEGHHATPSEISLSFYAHPEAVKTADLDPKIAPDNTFRDCFDFETNFPDGRIASDSSLASAEIGRELLDAAVRDVLETCTSFTG
ncbi:MAG: creatininase family protein [Desulfobacter sp.]|nr:MAG: creatininase family protein [Desulfobacter sp.]